MAESSRPKRDRKPTKVFEPEEKPPPKQKPVRKRARKEPFAFEQLPRSVRLRIVSFLNVGGLCSGASVSKDFKSLTEDNSIWGNQIVERFGHFFEEEANVESDEAIINNWPAKKIFKEVYRALSGLETQKQSSWVTWGSSKDKPKAATLGSEINGTCPMCDKQLFFEKNDAPKKEEDGEDEVPPSEFIIQCKTPKCGFVLPYSVCGSCKQPCNMMNTLVCPGEKCEKLPMASRIQCWDCAKECETPDKASNSCLNFLCKSDILTVKTKKGTAHSCPICAFNCKGCNNLFFAETEKRVCRKCKAVLCSNCSNKGCVKCGYKSDREEDEDDEFGAESEDDEEDFDDGEESED